MSDDELTLIRIDDTPMTRCERPYLYVYATGERRDGMRFAVGLCLPRVPADGSHALFRTAADANTYANVKAAQLDALVVVLPSANVA